VAVVIPAKDEAERIAATIAAARDLPGVSLVVVVDDGSRDHTAAVAQAAGAEVVRHAVNRGKGRAMQTGADYVMRHTECAALLFVDADLQETAAALAVLIARSRLRPQI
jgi:glycosyltransferase involved in cell wall biosynthesis